MTSFSPDPHGARVAGKRRTVRATLLATLFAVAAVYVWYCAPLGVTLFNSAIVGLLVLAAAVCAVLFARVQVRQRDRRDTICAPHHAIEQRSAG